MKRSIEDMNPNVDRRNEFGHWEIDTVIGSKRKSDNVVLTLLKHITCKYIALKITSKTSFAVKEGIAYLKEYYGTKFSQVFKTITSDNGRVFAELSQIENDTSTSFFLSIPIHLFIIIPILTINDILPPLPVLKIPFNGLFNAISKLCLR